MPPLREYQKELCGNDQERVDIVQLLGICMLAIATATYVPVLVDGALPPNKEKGEIVPTYKKEQTGSLTKEHLEETVQLLTKKQAAPEQKKTSSCGCFVTTGKDNKFGSGVHSYREICIQQMH